LLLLSSIDQASPRETAAIGHTIQKLAVALYMNQEYKAAQELLDAFLLEHRQYGFLTSRLLTLRMCIDFKQGMYDSALQFFDVAHEMNSYCFGSSHVVHVQLFCTLADLYYGVGAVAAAALQLTMAVDVARRVSGEKDILYAITASKLAAVELQIQGRVKNSIRNLSSAALIFDVYIAKGMAIGKEASECLYILANNLQQKQKLDIAINCAVQAVEIASKVFSHKTPPYVAACLLMLGDLFYRKGDTSSSLVLLDDAYAAVRAHADEYNNAGKTLAFIVSSILAVHKASLTLPSRILMATVESEIRSGEKQTGVSVPGSWDHISAEIAESLWDDKIMPTELLSQIVREFQESEATVKETGTSETKSGVYGESSSDEPALTDGQILGMKVAALEKLTRLAYPIDPPKI
jgi:tetratricopeptide (TPR) repeat protein